MAKQLNVNLAFTADTAKAAAGIRSLQNQLSQLMKTSMLDSNSLGLTKNIKEATTAVAQLKAQLNNATTSAGTLDLTKFNDSLKASGMSLEQYRSKLAALGPEGTAAFQQLASSISTADIPIRRTNKLLTELGTTLANTARWQLSSSLLHGFIGGLQHAYSYAQDLNESLNNIRIVTGQSTEQMAALAQKANQAARELSTRTTDYTNASLIYYQQGLDDKAVEERTRTALKLANVSRQSVEEVSTQMTAIWNNFDNGTKSLEYYADAITALGAKTASSSSEIAQGLSKFAAVADTIGLSYETASAAIATVVAETRQSADTVGNAFKSIFSRLESLKLGETLEDGVNLTKYTEALQTVGVQVLDINGNLKDADTILSELGDRWNEISDTQKVALANTVAGQRQYAQFVALFDNWDKVQENRNIAMDSEGTLQEQADIYAESWEAASKRVKASAETIYNALLDDKFFIDFNNFIAEFLDGINNIITGFGGLKGVLSTVGALVTQIFSNKIATNLERMGKNLKSFFLNGAEEKMLQQQSIDKLKEQAANSKVGTAQEIGLANQSKLQQLLLDKQKVLNEEQKETVQHILDQNVSLQKQATEAEKIANITKAKADKEQDRFLSGFTNGAREYWDMDKNVASLRAASEEGTKLTEVFEVLKSVMDNTTEDFSNVEVLKEQFGSISSELDSFVEKMNQLHESSDYNGLTTALNQLKQDVNSFDGTNIDKVKASLDNFLSIIRQTGIEGENTLKKVLVDIFEYSAPEADAAIRKLTGTFEQNGEAAADEASKILALIQAGKAGEDAINKMNVSQLSLSKAMTGTASLAMSLASTINSLRSAAEALNNEDLSFGEKFLQVVPTVLMSLGMLTNSIIGSGGVAMLALAKHLPFIGGMYEEAAAASVAAGSVTSLGAAILAALPIIGLAVAAFGALYLAFKYADKETPEEKLARVREEAEKTDKAFDNAKTAVEELSSSFDKYNEVREELSQCTTGTEEWQTALQNVNDTVIGIIGKFPELAKYLSMENGALSLDKDGMEEYENLLTNRKYGSYSAQLANNQQIVEAQTDVERERWKQNSLADDYTYKLSGLSTDTYEANGLSDIAVNRILDGITDRYLELQNQGADLSKLTYDDFAEVLSKYSDVQTGDLFEQQQAVFNDLLNDSDFISGLEEYASAVKEAAVIEEKNNQALANLILGEDEDYLRKRGAQESLGAAGDVLGRLKQENLQQIQDNDKFKDNSELIHEFQKYYGQTKGTGFEDVDGEQRLILNDEGDSFNREDIENYIAGAQASKDLANEMEGLINRTNELAISEDKASNSLADIIRRQDISNNGQDLKEAVDNARLKPKYTYKGEFTGDDEVSTTKRQIAKYLDNVFGDGLDGILKQSTLDDLGYETMTDIINAVYEGMEKSDKRISEARDLGDKTLNKSMSKVIDNNAFYNDLDVEQQEQGKNLLLNSLRGGGAEAFDALTKLFIESGSHINDVIESLSNNDIDWSSITPEELIEQLGLLGTAIESDIPSIRNIIDAFNKLNPANLESATEQYKAIHEAADDLIKDGEVDADKFEPIKKVLGDSINDYVTITANGTYKLISDAQEFYNVVNGASLQGFREGLNQELSNISTLTNLKNTYNNEKERPKEDLLENASNKNGGYNKDQANNQIEYLRTQNLSTEELDQLGAIDKDINDEKNGNVTSDHLEELYTLVQQYSNGWANVADTIEVAEKEADQYTNALMGSAKSASELESNLKLLVDKNGVQLLSPEEIDAKVKEWEDKIFDPKNISNLDEYTDAVSRGLLKTKDDYEQALKNIDFSDITKEQFNDIKENLDSSGLIQALQELYNSGEMSKNETLEEIINQVHEGSLEVKDAIPLYDELTTIDNETTAQTIDRINQKIKNGLGQASDYDTLLEKITSNKRTTSDEKTTNIKKEMSEIANDRNNLNVDQKVEELDKYASAGFDQIKDAGGSIEDQITKIDQLRDHYTNLFTTIPDLAALGPQVMEQTLSELDNGVMSLIADAENMNIDKKLELASEYMKNLGYTADETEPKLISLIANDSTETTKEKLQNIIDTALNGSGDLQQYKDDIVEVIANDSTMTTGEKLHELTNYLDINDARLFKEEILEILDSDASMKTGDKIAYLNALMQQGITTAQDYGSKLLKYMNEDENLSAVDKKLGLETNKENFVPNKPKQEDFEGKYGSQEEDKAAYSQAMEEFNADPTGIEAYTAAYQELVDTVQGSDFSSMNEWDDFFDSIPEGVSYIDQMNGTLEEYASHFSDLSDEIDRYNQLMALGKDTSEALVNLEVGARAHDMADAYDQSAQEIQEVATAMQKADSSLRDNAEAAVDAATRYVRLNHAVEDLKDNYEDYAKELRTIQKTENDVDKALAANTKTAQKMRITIADLVGTSEKFVDVNMLDAINPDDFEAAAQGDEEALGRIRQSFADSIDSAYDLGSAASDVLSEIATLGEGATIELDNSPAIQSLFDTLVQAGMSADEIESIFSGLGIDCDITPITNEMDALKAKAANTGNSIVSDLAFDAKANVMPVEETATKENVGFDETVTWTPSERTSYVAEGDNSTPVQVHEVIWQAHKTVTPQKESEDEKTEAKAVAMEMSNAKKSAGGNVSQNNKGGGGGGGGRGGGCFIAGTLISTANGFKNIEDIEIGDIVLSYNEVLRRNEYSKVLETMIHIVGDKIYDLYIENEKIICTGIHRFLITRYGEKKWIEAQDLKVGDFVQFADGSLHRIKQIDSNVTIKVVYNFEVNGNHNYYVGKNQILAHNKGGRRGGGGRGRTQRVNINATADKKSAENRYANVDRSLSNLNASYNKINKIKDLAFGKKHLDALKEEIKLNKQLIETNKTKYEETQKYLKEDLQRLTSTSGRVDANHNLTNANDTGEGLAKYSYTTKTSGGKGLTKKQQKKLNKLNKKENLTDKEKEQKKKLEELGKAEVTLTEDKYSEVSINDLGDVGKYIEKDANGNVIGMNYEELKKLNAKRYNDWIEGTYKAGASAAKTDAEKQKWENEKARWDAEYEAINGNIDKVWQDLQDLKDRVNDMIDQEISMLEKQIEKAVYLIDQKLEIDDSSISLLDFKINRLGDSGRNAAAQIGLISDKIKTLNTKAGDNMQGIKNLFNTVANKDNVKTIAGDDSKQKFTADWGKKNGFLNSDELVSQMSSSKEDDRKKAQATLLEMYKLGTLTSKQMDEIKARAQDQLSIVEEMRSNYQQIFDLMGNALNYYNAKMDDIIDQQNHLNNLVEHYRNVIDLVGKSQIAGSRAAGRAMEEQLDANSKSIANQNIKTYKEQLEGAEKLRDQLAAQRANAEARMNDQSKSASYREEWAQTYEKYDEFYKNQAAKANEAQENMNSAFEAALQTNLDSWTRAMDRAVEAFQEKMAGTAVSLDYLAEALDRFSKTHSTYVQDYEKVHQLRMLDLQAQKSIDEATDPKIKRELLEIQQEITAATTKDAKMSQYDLDFLKQKLELKQAEAAFEDAQKAKTQVSLTRDNEGNFGYVYTANDEDVQNAEQNYADKIYEMQKANAEYIQSLQTELVNAEQEYYQKMQEIANNTNLSTAEREAKMTQISEDYSALHEALTEQFQEALVVSNDIYGEYSNKYAEITGDLTACNLDYIGDFSQTRLAVETNYTSMKDFAEQWETATVAYMSDLKVAMEQYQADNQSTFESAGQDMSTYASTVKTQTDEIKKQTEALTTTMNTMATQANADFTAIVTAAQKAEEAYVGYMNSMIESVENFTSALIGAQEQMINLGDITESTTPSGTTIAGGGGGGNNPGEQTPIQAGSGNHGSITIWRQRGYKRIVKGLTAYQLRNVRAYKNKYRQLTKSSAWRRAQRRGNQAKLAKLRDKYIAKAAQAARNSLLKQLKKKKVNKVVVKYDTGGYTGTWNNNDGRLAMLHQKELVLNKTDTENILSAVSTVRDLASKIDLNALASQGAFTSMNAAGVGNLNNELEQHVSIEANFPNATSREEIQAAFENLIGLASQYANRSV